MIKINSKKNWMQSSVAHSIKGRVRLNIIGLSLLAEKKEQIAKDILKISGITEVKVTPITESILVKYHSKFTVSDIKESIDSVMGKYIVSALQFYQKSNSESSESESQISTKTICTRLVVNGCAFLLGNTLLKKQTASGISNFLSVQGIASAILAYPMLKSGIHGIRKDKRPNADFLTAISIGASLLSSGVNSALMILALSDVAEFMTSYTIERTRKSIRKMLSVDEVAVWGLLADGSLEKRSIDKVEVGDTVVVHTGEKISVDGVVVKGNCVVDQSAITGEFTPAEKGESASVFAGTLVKSGSVHIKAEKVGDSTVVSRIVQMIENNDMKKAPIQKYADKFSNYLVPLNFALAVAVWGVTKSPTKALKMLVIDYSCGIKLSTATAFSASINNAVKNGVLIKGGAYIEELSKASTVLLDKTGTVTKGKPKVFAMKIVDQNLTKKQILSYAMSAEETSSHPMSRATMDYGYKIGASSLIHGEVQTVVARGTQTEVDGKVVRVGNKLFLKENDVKMPNENLELINAAESYISLDDKLIGVLYSRDEIRADARRAVNSLRGDGVGSVEILTGDMEEQAEQVADMIGADGCKAQLLPEEKAEAVLKFQTSGHGVVMVGDGINDALALSYADVGISMGSKSTDIAIETADVVINRDDIMMIPKLRDLSEKTMSIVHQNFAMVVVINTVGLILGASSGISVMLSSIMHNSSTILVVGNSLRLLFFGGE